jgi:hypothetical protein
MQNFLLKETTRGDNMNKTYTGGGACGAIRHEISAEPLASNDCRRRDRQHGHA